MANFRLISGDADEVNRQLTITSLKNKEAAAMTEKPILMSTTVVGGPADAPHVILYVIIESQ